MPTTFRPDPPEQLLLLSPDVREWLPSGHPAHHVSDLVDAPNLNAFYAPCEGDDRRNAPYVRHGARRRRWGVRRRSRSVVRGNPRPGPVQTARPCQAGGPPVAGERFI